MPGKKYWMTVFKAGDYRHAGQGEWPEERVQAVEEHYNPEFHEAPLVVGHPRHNAPAYGWVEKVKRAGEYMKVLVRDVAPELVDAVKGGRFKKISASFYTRPEQIPGGQVPYLRHVGFQGAAVPVVKGLPAIEFAEDETAETFEFDIVEFAEIQNHETEGGTEMDDATKKEIGEMIGSAIAQFAETLKPKVDPKVEAKKAEGGEEFSEGEAVKKLREENEALKKRTVELELSMEQLSTAPGFAEKVKGDLETRDERIVELEKRNDLRDCEAFAEKLQREGRILPMHKALVARVMHELPDDREVEFAEGGETETLSPRGLYRKLCAGLPDLKLYGELAAAAGGGADFAENDADRAYHNNPEFARRGVTIEEHRELFKREQEKKRQGK